tara:strand:- start:1201 stop:1410 length:210 start_codon:yes stop_codon:yes gene_type:complete
MISKGSLVRYGRHPATSRAYADKVYLVLSDTYSRRASLREIGTELDLYVDLFMDDMIVSINVRRLVKVQ